MKTIYRILLGLFFFQVLIGSTLLSQEITAFQGSDNLWGFKDSSGKIIVQPQYYDIGDEISEGLIVVQKGMLFGYVDKIGKEVITPQFPLAFPFSEGRAKVGTIDYSSADPLASSRFGFIDKSGNVIVKALYNEVKDFKNGVAMVKRDGKWGAIDLDGKLIIPIQYEDINYLAEELISAKKNGKWGFIDKANNTIIPFQYEDSGSFYRGYSTVKSKGKWGYIDPNNKVIIPFILDQNIGVTLPYAMEIVATLYFQGHGNISQDYSEAIRWFKKAAELDNTAAMSHLGSIYYQGVGVEKNAKEAFMWKKKAAEGGYADAMYDLGTLYYHGMGVEKNQDEGMKWIKKAAENGSETAKKALNQ